MSEYLSPQNLESTSSTTQESAPAAFVSESPTPPFPATQPQQDAAPAREYKATDNEHLHMAIEERLREERDAWQARVHGWREEAIQDPTLGGDKLASNVARAQMALKRFDENNMVGQLLQESGYGNHPDIIRFFMRIAATLEEDGLVSGNPARELPPLEERMYANW